MEKLLCISNTCTDPYYNLATEEYLLKNRTENVFMLWQNKPTVVVGKHQNIHAEINHDFIKKRKINLARRLSGGGTVYHDAGNLNFTYIMTGEEGKMVDFTKYTDDILQVLNQLGAKAGRNERNDLVVNKKKISGNAEHIFKRRVIHHGTLLFDSNLDDLEEAIKVQEGKYLDKAVQSVRSKVTNILPFLTKAITIDEFRQELMGFMLDKYPNSEVYELNNDEKSAINDLRQKKYVTWDWVYGYSPKYVLRKDVKIHERTLRIELAIKKGIIENANLSGDLLDKSELLRVKSFLMGQKHDKEHLVQLFNNKGYTNIVEIGLIDQLF